MKTSTHPHRKTQALTHILWARCPSQLRGGSTSFLETTTASSSSLPLRNSLSAQLSLSMQSNCQYLRWGSWPCRPSPSTRKSPLWAPGGTAKPARNGGIPGRQTGACRWAGWLREWSRRYPQSWWRGRRGWAGMRRASGRLWKRQAQAPGSASVTTLPGGSLISRDLGKSAGRLKILGWGTPGCSSAKSPSPRRFLKESGSGQATDQPNPSSLWCFGLCSEPWCSWVSTHESGQVQAKGLGQKLRRPEHRSDLHMCRLHIEGLPGPGIAMRTSGAEPWCPNTTSATV